MQKLFAKSGRSTEWSVSTAMTECSRGVLWEDDRWLCLTKPAGLNVLGGRRSLANGLRGLQLARQIARDRGSSPDAEAVATAESAATAGSAAAAAVTPGSTARMEEAWTVAYDGDARIGGAWLVAKGAAGALAPL